MHETTLTSGADGPDLRSFTDGEEIDLNQEDLHSTTWHFIEHLVFILRLPFGLDQLEYVVYENLGLESWGDKKLYRVIISGPIDALRSKATVLWFDRDSGRLAQFAFDDGPHGSVKFYRATKSHRQNGVVLSDYEIFWAKRSSMTIDDVTPAGVKESMRLDEHWRIDSLKLTVP